MLVETNNKVTQAYINHLRATSCPHPTQLSPNPAESQSAHTLKPPSQQLRHQATKPVTQPATQPASQLPRQPATKPPSQPPSHWHPASQPASQRTHPANPPQTAFSTPLNLRDLVLHESVPISTNNSRYWPAFLTFSICHAHRQQVCLLTCFCAWVGGLLLVSFLMCGCCGCHCALHTS